MGAACCFAVSYLIASRLVHVVAPGGVVAMLSLTVAVGLAPLAWAEWVPVTAEQTGWLALVAATATVAQYAMMRAFDAASVSVTQPVTFLQLVWATILGIVLLAEPLDPMVLLGGVVIVGSVIALTLREEALRRRAARAVPDSP